MVSSLLNHSCCCFFYSWLVEWLMIDTDKNRDTYAVRLASTADETWHVHAHCTLEHHKGGFLKIPFEDDRDRNGLRPIIEKHINDININQKCRQHRCIENHDMLSVPCQTPWLHNENVHFVTSNWQPGFMGDLFGLGSSASRESIWCLFISIYIHITSNSYIYRLCYI